MKKQSISFRLNTILSLIILVMFSFSMAIIYLGNQVNHSTKKVIENDMPAALNTLAMLEELGDMNSNLLEYLLGEREERQEYYSNYDEFHRFRMLIPENIEAHNLIERVERIVEEHKSSAEKNVFMIYDPRSEQKGADQINDLIENVGKPLEILLDELKNEEIADAGSGNDFNEVMHDDLPGVRFYLELVDEAGDMLADLDRFVLGHLDAKRAFYDDALQFENYLLQLKPLEQKTTEIIRINEIERLFKELKNRGGEIFSIYSVRSKIDATQAIDDLEHQSFLEAEKILDKLSSEARENVDFSMKSLGKLASKLSWILGMSTAIIIVLTVIITFYIRKTIFVPLSEISSAINKLRRGERDFTLTQFDRNDELTDILGSLKQFQVELTELDELRLRDTALKDELLLEKNITEQSLLQLKDTQSKLVETEKMASLGALVAGVAHEINTPLGISVTMSSTLNRNCKSFLTQVKSGQLQRSSLELFEEESIESFNLLAVSLEQASNLIHSFKQVAMDQTSSKRRTFNLLETLNEIMSTLHHRIKLTNIKYTIEGPSDIEMDSYPGPFGQVITNLFNNAMLHAFADRESGEINIRFNMLGSDIRVLFSDNGAGVDDNHIEKLFDPFFTTKLGKGGSGLGLNIVHNIITTLLGGTIHVESKIGTTFDMKLPAIAPQHRGNDNE